MARSQNRFRNAAQQMPAHGTRPLCAHHDEIRFECLSSLHERTRDACTVRIDYLGDAAYPVPRAEVARVIEEFAASL